MRPQSVPFEKNSSNLQGLLDLDGKKKDIARPKAPIMMPTNTKMNPKRSRQKTNCYSSQKQHQTLKESFDSLAFFDKNNRGRVLSTKEAGDENVHFVNIEESSNSMLFQEVLKMKNGKMEKVANTKFRIPELPHGNAFSLNILSTWYVYCV